MSESLSKNEQKRRAKQEAQAKAKAEKAAAKAATEADKPAKKEGAAQQVQRGGQHWRTWAGVRLAITCWTGVCLMCASTQCRLHDAKITN
eukprot:6177704-Pleurochrysis_carterae.AAC.2